MGQQDTEINKLLRMPDGVAKEYPDSVSSDDV
jgi:hypothetical protein